MIVIIITLYSLQSSSRSPADTVRNTVRVSKVLLQMLPPTCPAMTPGSSVWPACPPHRTAPWWSVACAAAPHAACWLGSGRSPPVAAVFLPPGCGLCSPPAVPWTAGSPCPGCSAETVSNQKGTSNALDLARSLVYIGLKLKVLYSLNWKLQQ